MSVYTIVRYGCTVLTYIVNCKVVEYAICFHLLVHYDNIHIQ